jgi:hypothetical protein
MGEGSSGMRAARPGSDQGVIHFFRLGLACTLFTNNKSYGNGVE